MLEKLSPNQRLLLAVALSFAFFIGYTTLFPPKAPNGKDANKSVQAASSAPIAATQTAAINPSESKKSDFLAVKTVTSDTLTTINAKEFSLKVDTLGRISSVVLKNTKHDNKDGKLAELIPLEGAKPLQMRFADADLDSLAQKTPFSSNVDDIVLGENGKAEIILHKYCQILR